MKKFFRNIHYWYDYYIGVFFYKKENTQPWHIYMIYKYPEKFQKEIEYLEKEKQKNNPVN